MSKSKNSTFMEVNESDGRFKNFTIKPLTHSKKSALLDRNQVVSLNQTASAALETARLAQTPTQITQIQQLHEISKSWDNVPQSSFVSNCVYIEGVQPESQPRIAKAIILELLRENFLKPDLPSLETTLEANDLYRKEQYQTGIFVKLDKPYTFSTSGDRCSNTPALSTRLSLETSNKQDQEDISDGRAPIKFRTSAIISNGTGEPGSAGLISPAITAATPLGVIRGSSFNDTGLNFSIRGVADLIAAAHLDMTTTGHPTPLYIVPQQLTYHIPAKPGQQSKFSEMIIGIYTDPQPQLEATRQRFLRTVEKLTASTNWPIPLEASSFQGEIHATAQSITDNPPRAHTLVQYPATSVSGLAKGLSLAQFSIAVGLDNPTLDPATVKGILKSPGPLRTNDHYAADYHQILWTSHDHPKLTIGHHLTSLQHNSKFPPTARDITDAIRGRETLMLRGTPDTRAAAIQSKAAAVQRRKDRRNQPQRDHKQQGKYPPSTTSSAVNSRLTSPTSTRVPSISSSKNSEDAHHRERYAELLNRLEQSQLQVEAHLKANAESKQLAEDARHREEAARQRSEADSLRVEDLMRYIDKLLQHMPTPPQSSPVSIASSAQGIETPDGPYDIVMSPPSPPTNPSSAPDDMDPPVPPNRPTVNVTLPSTPYMERTASPIITTAPLAQAKKSVTIPSPITPSKPSNTRGQHIQAFNKPRLRSSTRVPSPNPEPLPSRPAPPPDEQKNS